MTRCFFWLMQRAGFPYRECQLGSRLDCMLLQQLKETFCHLDQVCLHVPHAIDTKGIFAYKISSIERLFKQDICGLQDHEFRTRFPESPVILYQVRLGDEKLQVETSYYGFTTTMVLILGSAIFVIKCCMFVCL